MPLRTLVALLYDQAICGVILQDDPSVLHPVIHVDEVSDQLQIMQIT
jgi:hypothetical protein